MPPRTIRDYEHERHRARGARFFADISRQHGSVPHYSIIILGFSWKHGSVPYYYAGGRLQGWDDLVKEWDVPAVSGPWSKGRLPNGNYNGTNLRRRNDNKAMTCDGKGWSLDLNPAFDTDRTLLRIHPDGNVPGTEGCNGPSCGADQQKVYDSLKTYFDGPGYTTIPVIVR